MIAWLSWKSYFPPNIGLKIRNDFRPYHERAAVVETAPRKKEKKQSTKLIKLINSVRLNQQIHLLRCGRAIASLKIDSVRPTNGRQFPRPHNIWP